MNYSQIQQDFQRAYSRSAWSNMISQIFPGAQIWARPDKLNDIDNHAAHATYKLGQITLDENGIERTISVFEVQLSPGIVLERNRVGLRNLLKKYWKYMDGAFVSYYQPGKPNWRFTYVSELTGWDAEGEQYKIQTEPKRYTYILGETETCRTAAERFAILSEKGRNAGLKDVMDAFSVEKLSKAFFDEYKLHYQKFCDFMLSKPGISSALFSNEDKGIRDFAKKMLGRIVFLYFIQKKGWLGVPKGKSWGEGDPEFLTNLFIHAPFKPLFYSSYLTKLFFDTLNTPRANDEIEIIPGNLYRIPYLNGGLFEEENPLYRQINFPPELFSGLFDFFSHYNFTIYEDDPDDQIVAVDPEMLGHIFENLLEDNKDKGAFYTPKEIVHYMCQESLTEYLATWFEQKGYQVTGFREFAEQDEPLLFSPNEGRIGQQVLEIAADSPDKSIDRLIIENLLKKRFSPLEKIVLIQHADEINKALDNVKICDPAIGSGAFPMGLLHEIYSTKQTLFEFKNGNLDGFDASAVKLNIIQNSIYGVDIEKGAVDIARLRFWLSLIVDEPQPKPLPNLDYKIVVGNSLVSKYDDETIIIDWNLNETSHGLFADELAKQKILLLKKISQKQKEYFNPFIEKKNLSSEIRDLKIDLLINQLSLMIKTANLDTKPVAANFNDHKKFLQATEMYLQIFGWKNSIRKLRELKEDTIAPLLFFDWKLDFPEVMNEQVVENVGFDIVIGNPPYIQLQKDDGALAKVFERLNFETFERTGDIYALFFEKGFHLVKERGVLTYITSSQWLRANYGKSLRTFFLKYNPLILLCLGPGVFESAVVDTSILIAQKSNYKLLLRGKTITNTEEISVLIPDDLFLMSYIDSDPWAILNTKKLNIKEKCFRFGRPLKNWNININRGILTGLNEAFIIDQDKRLDIINNHSESSELIKPLLRGREIQSYLTNWDGGFIIATFPSYNLNIENYQGIKVYLEQFKPKINQTGETFINQTGKEEKTRKKTNNKWFEIQDPISYHNEFQREKIIWKRIGSSLRFSYSNEEMYCLDSTCIATGEKIKYLTGLLNSKLCKYQLFETSPRTGMGDLLISVQALEPLLVHYPTDNEETLIISIVDKILLEKSKKHDTILFEQQLDNLVYKLYDLTYDEVKEVDPEFPLSEAEYLAIKVE